MRYQETSREAWQSVQPSLGAVDARIVETIRACGSATCDDIERLTSLEHQTASAQIRHLVQRGVLEDAGEYGRTRRGKRAKRWRVAPPRPEGRLF